MGGAVFYAPPTHTQAKYHQPHRAVTHQERGAPEPPLEQAVDLFASTGGGHRRTDDGELNAAGEGGGGGQLNDTDGEEVKEREETGELQGTGNPGESGRGVSKCPGHRLGRSLDSVP